MIDDVVTWGKYKDRGLTYREMAAAYPGYCAWAARKIGGLNGQRCAEALVTCMGVA